MTKNDEPAAEPEAVHPDQNEAAANASQALRWQAERLLNSTALSPEIIETLSSEATRQMLHELRVHQIELEMQNEELRESQLALDVERARYFDLYDLAPIGYCTVSAQGQIVQTNLTAAKLLGVTRSALIKRPLSQFILKADQDSYYLCRNRLLKTGEPQSCELRMMKHDGSTLWVHFATTTAQDADGAPALRVVLSDISERKRAELVTERLAAIVDSSDDAVISMDLQGIIVSWNRGAEKIFGYSPGEILGKPVTLLIPLERRAEEGQILEKIMRGESVHHFDTVRRQRDGTAIDVGITISPIKDEAGKIIGVSRVACDITQSKEMARLLQKNNEALEVAVLAADNANRAKSEFLSNMSHELRTPLNAILGFAQLLEAGPPPPTPMQKRGVDHILQAGWYLLALVDEILDLAVVESGKLSLSMEVVSLKEVMQECQAMLEQQAQERGIHLLFQPHSDLHHIYVDRNRVKQILSNLISNAIKYNRTDGTVTVEWMVNPVGRLLIRVRDTGEGISPTNVTQLFQPFNRLGKEATAVKGTGIGLVMTKRLVELMGGTIGVESTLGVGSVFWIELSLTSGVSPSSFAKELTLVSDRQIAVDAKIHTLLYVEDNPANLMLVEEIITRRPDLRLLSARDGISGVKLALEALPDVILMDINLPGMSGFHALAILREDPATAHIPVIALSANAIPRDIRSGLEAGFFRYLTKPIKIKEFLETLDAALRHVENKMAGSARKESS